MKLIFDYLKEPNESTLSELIKKDNKYKIILIIIVFSLFPILNSLFEWVKYWLSSFISNTLWDLIAEWFFVFVIYYVAKLLNWKWKFIDIFFSIALANIVMILTSIISNSIHYFAPSSWLADMLIFVIACVWFIWYVNIWIKWISIVEKISKWKTIVLSILSFISLRLFYIFFIIWLFWTLSFIVWI